jgi:hypothetical protein
MRRRSLLLHFLDLLDSHGDEAWYRRNAALYLEVCKIHGQAAAQHHDQLVQRFIRDPSQALAQPELDKVTASGPPLEVVVNALEKLRDLRMAVDRSDIPSSFNELALLRGRIGH